jgi:hypothetical protein
MNLFLRLKSFSVTKLAYYIDFCCGDILTFLRVFREICVILASFA